MDSQQAVTVAEAVAAAANAQQQQQQQQGSPSVQPVQGTPSSAIDNLTCQWQGCGERCDSAEALYVRLHNVNTRAIAYILTYTS
jgi:hypothetical protein